MVKLTGFLPPSVSVPFEGGGIFLASVSSSARRSFGGRKGLSSSSAAGCDREGECAIGGAVELFLLDALPACLSGGVHDRLAK